MGSITNAANYLQKVIEKDPKNKDAQNDVSNITLLPLCGACH